MLFDFSKLETLHRYKILSFTVLPRPIAWVITEDKRGARNAAPFSFFNVLTTDPPLIALGFTERNPQGKNTPAKIAETGEFVVNLVPFSLLEQMNITAIEFPREVDELTEADLTVVPSEKVRPPRIAESPVALECRLWQQISLESGQSIILGEVLAVHLDDAAVIDGDKCYVDSEKLDLIGRLNNRYVRPTDTVDLPRLTEVEWRARHGKAG